MGPHKNDADHICLQLNRFYYVRLKFLQYTSSLQHAPPHLYATKITYIPASPWSVTAYASVLEIADCLCLRL